MSSTTPGSDPDRPHDQDADAVEPEPSTEAADTAVHEPVAAEPAAASDRPDPDVEPEPRREATPADATPEAAPVDVAPAAPDDTIVDAEPVAAEPAPAADTSRLDEAVQRANAERLGDDVGEAGAPEPVPAGAVRRETYVPAATVATGAAAGAATLAPEPDAVPTAFAAPQTIYVQAPTPPKMRSNRGFGVLVALVAAVVFALLYAGIGYLVLLAQSDPQRAAEVFTQFVVQPVYWVPVIATFVGFTILAVIVNRGPWWAYAVFGLLVGVFVYLSYIGAALLTVQAWAMTLDQASDFIGDRWLDPFALIAGILAREITIWLGGWMASRGRAVTERNRLAREAYDRELAAGPQPIRQ